MPKKKAAAVDLSSLDDVFEAARMALDDVYPPADAGEAMGDSDFLWTAKALRTREKIIKSLDTVAELLGELPDQLRRMKGAGSPLRLLTRAGFDEAEAKDLIRAIKKKCA